MNNMTIWANIQGIVHVDLDVRKVVIRMINTSSKTLADMLKTYKFKTKRLCNGPQRLQRLAMG